MTLNPVEHWFTTRGWQPNTFQREVWAAMAAGESGLLHATTGSGKTYAVWMGALARARPGPGLQVLWLTPVSYTHLDVYKRQVNQCSTGLSVMPW